MGNDDFFLLSFSSSPSNLSSRREAREERLLIPQVTRPEATCARLSEKKEPKKDLSHDQDIHSLKPQPL